MTKIYHPLLALIASAGSNELAKYIEYLKQENKILRARIPGQTSTYISRKPRVVTVFTEKKSVAQSVFACR